MVGSMGKLIDDLSQPVTDFTENGQCTKCGQCCGDILPVSRHEIDKIRKYIKENGITENINRPPTCMPTIDMTCPFRNEKERKCDIYPVRPLICKDFMCNKPPTEADKLLFSSSRKVISMRNTFFKEGKK